MLAKLRDQALRAIAAAPGCTLSTVGPAGLQASRVDCRVHENRIFVDVPTISDHLFNLEHEEQVLLTADRWRLRGRAKRLKLFEDCNNAACPGNAPYQQFVVFEVIPVQIHLESVTAGGHQETIDF